MICILRMVESEIRGWIIATDAQDARRQALGAGDLALAEILGQIELPLRGKHALPNGDILLASAEAKIADMEAGRPAAIGDLQWQVDQWREQNLAILGQWHAEKKRADAAEAQLANSRASADVWREKYGEANQVLADGMAARAQALDKLAVTAKKMAATGAAKSEEEHPG